MNPIIAVLGVLLAVSIGGNALLASAYMETREQAALNERARKTAADAAGSCSAGVKRLQDAAKQQADAHAKALDAAREAGRQAGLKAAGERNRPQAVPGDACASATVETREWLLRRQGGVR